MVPSIQQLQEMYKFIYGEEAGDIHRLRAAHHYNIPYESVTPDQRLAGRAINNGTAYSSDFAPITKVLSFRPRKEWSFRPTV